MVVKTVQDDGECLRVRCIWYDPWESDCIADNATLDSCPCHYYFIKNQGS
ncbi:MAG: hypothetical protein ACXADW_18070 [Candidatus Hodarchaeales archaeon]